MPRRCTARHGGNQQRRRFLAAPLRHRTLALVVTVGFTFGAAPAAVGAPAPVGAPVTHTHAGQPAGRLPLMPGATVSPTDQLERMVQVVQEGRARDRAAAKEGVAVSVRLGADVAQAALAPRWRAPMQGYRLTSRFGPRWGRAHNGVDLAAPIGGPVAALTAGTVRLAEQQQGYGNLIVITHPDGTESHYAHLDSLGVRPGDKVAGGQLIAKSGNTGHSTGPHLHLEIHVDGQPVDPMVYLEQRGVRLADHASSSGVAG